VGTSRGTELLGRGLFRPRVVEELDPCSPREESSSEFSTWVESEYEGREIGIDRAGVG
jgi:hypothetical protein